MLRALVTGLFLLMSLGGVRPVSAADIWTTLHPGVEHLHRIEAGQVIHLAEIDLSEEAISIRVTRETEGWVVPSAIAQSLGSAVTINGDWATQGKPFGLSVGAGWQWTDASDPPNPPASPHDWLFFACNVEKECFFDSPGVQQPWQWIWHNVIGGNEAVLIAGGAGHYPPGASYSADRHPRSAICLDASGTLLRMFVIQGRRSDSLGMTFWETADLLLSFGCHDAMMLDGGGSSGLALDGVLVNGRPSNEPAERSVPNHFSVLYTPEFNSECVTAPNGRSCSGATLQLCQGGQLEESDCSFFGAACEEGEGTAYCVHPSCTNGGFDSLCLDATVLGNCSYGQLTEVDCSVPFGLHCAEDEGEGLCTDPRCTMGPNSDWCEGQVAKTCSEGAFSELDCALVGLTCLEGECLEGDDDDAADDDDSAVPDDDDDSGDSGDDTVDPPDEDEPDESTDCNCSVGSSGRGQHFLLFTLGFVTLWRARRTTLGGKRCTLAQWSGTPI